MQTTGLGSVKMKAQWMKLCGIALLWVGLAALGYVPATGGGTRSVIIAGLGFISFASGLSLFADALKYGIIHELRRE